MAFLAQADRDAITQMFEDLVNPVRLVLFTLPTSRLIVPGRATCETCDDTQHVLEEVVGLSEKLSLEVHNFSQETAQARQYGVERVPTLIILGPEDGRVRYSGAPFGREFALLLQDIQDISKQETRLAQATREALAAIDKPVAIQVFVTPT